MKNFIFFFAFLLPYSLNNGIVPTTSQILSTNLYQLSGLLLSDGKIALGGVTNGQIMYQLYSANLTGPFGNYSSLYQVSDAITETISYFQAVALSEGGFVIAWNKAGFHYQIYDNNASLLFNNTYSYMDGEFSMTSLVNGGFALATLNNNEVYLSTFDKTGVVIVNYTCVICESSSVYYSVLQQITENKLTIAYVATNGSNTQCFSYAKILDLSGNQLSVVSLSCGSSYHESYMNLVINPVSQEAVAGWQCYTSNLNNPNYAYAVFDSTGTLQTNCTFLDSTSATKDSTTGPDVYCLSNGTCLLYYATVDSNWIRYVKQVEVNSIGGFLNQNTDIFTSETSFYASVIAFSDNSYLFSEFNYTDNYQYATFYNSQGHVSYSCLSCSPTTEMMNTNKTICFSSIPYCQNYNFSSGTCQKCNDSSLVLSISGEYCLIPNIKNCTSYDYNQNANSTICAQCDNTTALTQGQLACVKPIQNCLTYSDDSNCSSCNTSTILTIGKIACAPNINDCSVYNDNFTCQICTTNFALTMSQTSCAAVISNCIIYSDDGTCHTCQDNFAVSTSENKCVSADVSGCSQYDDNGICLACSGTKVLSTSKNTCVNVIYNCYAYNDDGICQSCISSAIMSIDNKTCVILITNCINYTNNGFCLTCGNNTILTENKLACATPIDNCTEYSDDELCSQCNSSLSLELTIGKIACADSVPSCETYSDDKNCSTCSVLKALTISKQLCVNQITDCTSYSDNSTCLTCGNSKILSVTNFSCVTPINNCSSINDHLKCLNCTNNTLLTEEETACAIPITDCQIYSDDTKCLNCQNNTVLTVNKTFCVPIISNCESYSDDALCINCTANYNLTEGKVACANPIQYCLNYSDNQSCFACQVQKALTANLASCVDIINYCLVYSNDNGICQVCRNGTDLSADKTSCNLNLTETKLPDDEAKTVSSNISLNISTKIEEKYLSKSKLQNIVIKNNYTNYALNVNNDQIEFVDSSSNVITIPILNEDNSNPSVLNISINVSAVNSNSYYVKLDIVFTLKNRILQSSSPNGNLPDFFVVTYQTPTQYYVGTDDQIQAEANATSTDSGFNSQLFAILFSIFMFFFIVVLVIVVVVICKRKTQSKDIELKSQDFEPVPIFNPSNQGIIDEEQKKTNRGNEGVLNSSPTEKQLYDSTAHININ